MVKTEANRKVKATNYKLQHNILWHQPDQEKTIQLKRLSLQIRQLYGIKSKAAISLAFDLYHNQPVLSCRPILVYIALKLTFRICWLQSRHRCRHRFQRLLQEIQEGWSYNYFLWWRNKCDAVSNMNLNSEKTTTQFSFSMYASILELYYTENPITIEHMVPEI